MQLFEGEYEIERERENFLDACITEGVEVVAVAAMPGVGPERV